MVYFIFDFRSKTTDNENLFSNSLLYRRSVDKVEFKNNYNKNESVRLDGFKYPCIIACINAEH